MIFQLIKALTQAKLLMLMSPLNIWRTTLNYTHQTLFIIGQMWFLTQRQQVWAEEA